jgi:hypothetical protein
LLRFTQSLSRAPKRLQALEGRLKAARALQQMDLVQEIEADLAEIQAKAAAQLL